MHTHTHTLIQTLALKHTQTHSLIHKCAHARKHALTYKHPQTDTHTNPLYISHSPTHNFFGLSHSLPHIQTQTHTHTHKHKLIFSFKHKLFFSHLSWTKRLSLRASHREHRYRDNTLKQFNQLIALQNHGDPLNKVSTTIKADVS